MSYLEREISREDGQPFFLYQFAMSGQFWRYTNSIKPETVNGELWAPAAITHTEVKSSEELSKSSITIDIEPSAAVAENFDSWAPEHDMVVTVLRTHHGDLETYAMFLGRVGTHQRKAASVKLKCESFYTSLAKNGVRGHVQINCRHALYSLPCGVDKSLYEVAGTISASSANGLVLTVAEAAAFEDGYFRGGIVTFPDNSSRSISGHVGDEVTLGRPSRWILDNELPIAMSLYPGCPKSRDVCLERYNNILNYGGFPWIPGKNPLGGISII